MSKEPIAVYMDESSVDVYDNDRRNVIGKRFLVTAAATSNGNSLDLRAADAVERVLADEAYWEPRDGHRKPHERRSRFQKEGFHYVYDSESIQSEGLKAMLIEDARIHVVYSGLLDSKVDQADLHLALLQTLVRSILQRYSGHQVQFVFEEAGAAVQKYFGSAVAHAASSLDNNGGGSFCSVTGRIASKPLGGLSLADYAMGVISRSMSGARHEPRLPQKEQLWKLMPRVAQVRNFDRSSRRRGKGILDLPSWARHMKDVISRPGVADAYPSLISEGSTGPFAFLPTKRALASALGYDLEGFDELLDIARDISNYEVMPVVVKGKQREFVVSRIESVSDLHKRIGNFLAPAASVLHESCCAYVAGRGALDAARPHAGKAWKQRLDIKDFFGSTTLGHVEAAMKSLGASPEIAGLLAELITYSGSLPTGRSTSPIVSNFVLAELDLLAARLADERGLIYSRYADDLFFSGDDRFDVANDVELLLPEGYELNWRKTRVRKKGQPFRIAGLSVEDQKPHVRKPLKRKLRMEVFLLNKTLSHAYDSQIAAGSGQFGPVQFGAVLDTASPAMMNHAQGLARYTAGIEFEWTMNLLSKFPFAQAAIFPRNPTTDRIAVDVKMVADEIRLIRCPLGDAARKIYGNIEQKDDLAPF